MNQPPFSSQAITLKVSVTATASASTALPALGNVIRVVNEGPAAVFLSVGTGSQTATVPATSSPVATCTPVLAGEDAVFGLPKPEGSAPAAGGAWTAPTVLNFSLITGGGTATAYVSVGEGT